MAAGGSVTSWRCWGAEEKDGELKMFTYEAGPLPDDEIEIIVDHSGLCHSDHSMLGDEWGMTTYPFVPGHEVVGTIAALGPQSKGLEVGQLVGVGWYARSCTSCGQCLGGEQNLCSATVGTIAGRHGGFAERVRAHWQWAIPIPEALRGAPVGPLLCGGITVFTPLLEYGILPTMRVGVIGIGGLGHMALKFAKAWGCEVVAFTSTAAKGDEARALGAHRVVDSRDPKAIREQSGPLDLIISTVNVPVDYAAYIDTLAPKGRFHVVGAVLEPMSIAVFPLLVGQKSVSASPTGSRQALVTMLDFAARHHVVPMTEEMPLSQCNEAFKRLLEGKARYRIVLKADFAK